MTIENNFVEMIAATLREDIWSGRLKSGQPLRQDEIAARFDVSKIPVREALFQLKAEGLVTFYPNRGAVVSELSAKEVEEIYTMRSALEVAALQAGISRLTIADLQRAAQILEVLDGERNMARWSELNWEFHAVLYSPADMPRLMNTVKTLHFNISRYLIIYLGGMDFQSRSQAEHRQILEACRQGDVQEAVRILQRHLDSACRELVSFLGAREI